MDELSQLDELIESDILDALGQDEAKEQDLQNELIEAAEEEISIEDFNEPVMEEETLNSNEVIDEIEENITPNENTQVISEVNTNDLASLLSQLLNNKTIEITIKIKD